MLFLALKSITEGQVGVDVVLAVLDALLEVTDCLGVLTADAVQDASVVMHNWIYWIQVDRAVVVIQRVCELSSSLHVDAHVLQDARLARVVPDGVLVLRQGFLTVAKLLMDDAQVDFGFVVVWVEFQNLIQTQLELRKMTSTVTKI